LGVAEGRSVDPTFAEFCMVFPFCRRGSLQEDLANRRQTKQFFERKVLLEFFRQVSLKKFVTKWTILFLWQNKIFYPFDHFGYF